jgi:hypothetical protein
MTFLNKDPLAEGDYYPGYLLGAVLALPADFWSGHRDLAAEVERIAASVPDEDLLPPLPERIASFHAAVTAWSQRGMGLPDWASYPRPSIAS